MTLIQTILTDVRTTAKKRLGINVLLRARQSVGTGSSKDLKHVMTQMLSQEMDVALAV